VALRENMSLRQLSNERRRSEYRLRRSEYRLRRRG
jgi:hypothetical protein